jgi:UDP-N-acetylmuramate dehydrogenase
MEAPGLTIKLQEPLAPYTSWRVGGVADRLCVVEALDALQQFLATLPQSEPLFWMGRGSNLLVRDGGIRGTVILLSQGDLAISLREPCQLTAEAGVSLSRLARTARSAGCGHFNFLAGIPGTVGGALAMNAGAFGEEIWPLVESVEVMDRHGTRSSHPPQDFTIGYRSVVAGPQVAQGWFVSATFRAQLPGAEGGGALQQQLKQRNRTQPMAEYSCGSVFRNPAGDHAGRLIEASGLKGYCIGAACVSSRHANFIVHRGAATAAEIEALMGHVVAVVAAQQGVTLQPEVRIVGEVA